MSNATTITMETVMDAVALVRSNQGINAQELLVQSLPVNSTAGMGLCLAPKCEMMQTMMELRDAMPTAQLW